MSILSTYSLRVALDYGQFLIRGAQPSDFFDDVLVDRAFDSPPSYSDRQTMLVLSPHQNNFDMAVDVEVWDQRPQEDRDAWQQVSEDKLTVDSEGLLRIDSPTCEQVTCTVPQGNYTVEASGRGFVTRGWPGSTKPGDTWRVRLWPDTGDQPQSPKLWNEVATATSQAPDAPAPRTEPSGAGDPSEPLVQLPVFTPKQVREDPVVAAIQGFAGAYTFFSAAPKLAAVLTRCDPDVQREVAMWAAREACTFAGIADLPWVRDTLSRAPKDHQPDLATRYRAARRQSDPTQPGIAPENLFSYADPSHAMSEYQTYGTNIVRHRAAFAIVTLAAACQPNPLQAAVEATHCASLTLGKQAQSLQTRLRILLESIAP